MTTFAFENYMNAQKNVREAEKALAMAVRRDMNNGDDDGCEDGVRALLGLVDVEETCMPSLKRSLAAEKGWVTRYRNKYKKQFVELEQAKAELKVAEEELRKAVTRADALESKMNELKPLIENMRAEINTKTKQIKTLKREGMKYRMEIEDLKASRDRLLDMLADYEGEDCV